jgi:hypothetical protein
MRKEEQNLRDDNLKYTLLYLIISIFYYCDLSNQELDLHNLNSNVIILTSIYYNDDRLYIIPIKEQDSSLFKKIDIAKAINDNVCVQLNFGSLKSLSNSLTKKSISLRNCKLPSDTMYYALAHITYINYTDLFIESEEIKKSLDSCNTKVLSYTDSSQIREIYFYK